MRILHQNPPALNPQDGDLSYKERFEALDYEALKEDLAVLMRTSQPWWPADYGHYGPFFIRMAWHSAGTYRIMDGRGGAGSGAQRFAPLNSWPDNTNLDKARRLLWPIKKKYGNAISWADLIVLAGNVAMESMGFETLGFGGGREDIWESEIDIYWGSESEWLADERHKDEKGLENPLAAVQMGLIYVNPEGPDGEPNVLAAAEDIRESFRRMGMNDEETIALIAGGHTFGKSHGAADPQKYIGAEPEAAPIQEQGLGWKSSYKSGKGADTITSGLEGAWTPTPTKWDNSFLRILFKYEWNLQKSPAGAWQWVAVNPDKEDMSPDAHIEGLSHAPIMFTTDLALRMDPAFEKISRRFLEEPSYFAQTFAHAWFKLTHRDMGPKARYLGPEVPHETYIWQDPLPPKTKDLPDAAEIKKLKKRILSCGIPAERLIYTAWSSASSYRHSDKRGGANGARIVLEPQCSWEINMPGELSMVIEILKKIQNDFYHEHKGEKSISLADLIVLGGTAAVEEAAKKGGVEIEVPFTPGRVDATQEQTDPFSFAYLRTVGDGFRNYYDPVCKIPAEQLLLDRAQQLSLTVPEMTVLVGGLRVLGATYGKREEGVFTKKRGVLSNDFFVTLTDMNIAWQPAEDSDQLFEGINCENGDIVWRATRADLIFGSNAQLRAQSEFYAQDDNKEKFVHDFVKAWHKVMELDRFDLKLQ
jgi:catalase-peroxidase